MVAVVFKSEGSQFWRGWHEAEEIKVLSHIDDGKQQGR